MRARSFSIKVLAYALFVELVIVVALILPHTPRVEAGTCSDHYWESTKDATSTKYYGAYGYATVQDASVQAGSTSFFVNSTSIRYNDDEWAEVGWRWAGDESNARAFVAWSKRGKWGFETFQTLATGTHHYFETRRQSNSSTQWNWYVDGVLKKSLELPRLKSGVVVAQQERYNVCDNVTESHWWSLRRMNSGGSYSWWDDLVEDYTNDPDYCVHKISNTEFKTPKTGNPNC